MCCAFLAVTRPKIPWQLPNLFQSKKHTILYLEPWGFGFQSICADSTSAWNLPDFRPLPDLRCTKEVLKIALLTRPLHHLSHNMPEYAPIGPNFFLIERAPYFLCGNAGVWFLTHLCGFCGLLETDRFSPDFRPSPARGKSLFSVKYLQVGISSWKMDGF